MSLGPFEEIKDTGNMERSRASLDSHDNTPFLEESRLHQRPSRTRRIWPICWALNIFIFTCNIIIILRSLGSTYDVDRDSEYAEYAPLKSFTTYQNQYWNLTFGEKSPYTNPPGPVVDAAWDEITAPPGKVGFVAVQKKELQRMNLSSIELSDGRGYLATVDVFHQLHCLNMLRMAIADKKSKPEEEDVRNDHIAHCIDSIRLSLQCNSDTSLLTFKWLKYSPQPWPDFRSYHKCRNWDRILEWGRANMVDTKEKDLFIHPIFGSISQNFTTSSTPPKSDKAAFLENP